MEIEIDAQLNQGKQADRQTSMTIPPDAPYLKIRQFWVD
jgi:hypothetical protein